MPIRAALLVAVIIASALLRAIVIGTGFWGDEVTSIFSASQHGVGTVVERLAIVEINPPLFFFLLHAWIFVAGHDDVLLKVLPLAFGVAIVPLTYALGCRVAPVRVALLAAALAAANDTLAVYASELRPYSLAGFFCVLATIFYVRWFSNGRVAPLAGAVICTTAALYTTYLAVLFIAALVAATLVAAPLQRVRLGGIAAFVLLPPALFAPWIPVLRRQFAAGAAWDEPLPLLHRPVWIASRGYQALPFDVAVNSTLPHALTNGLGIVVIAALVALLVAFYRAPSPETAGYDHSGMRIVVGTFLLIVIVEAAANLGSVRYISFALPLGLLGVAACVDLGIANLRARLSQRTGGGLVRDRAALALGVATILFAAVVLVREAREPKSGMRAAAALYAAPLPQDTLVIVAPDHAAETFVYYAGSIDRVHGFPRWEHPDVFDLRGYGALWNEPGIVDRTLGNIEDQRRQGLSKLLYVESKKAGQPLQRIGQLDYPKVDELYDRLKARYRLLAVNTYPARAEPAVASLFSLQRRPGAR